MNRALPFDNRLCYERDIVRQQKFHKEKVKMMLPTCHSHARVQMDCISPVRASHSHNNAKKQQMDREKQQEVYEENRRLVSRMEHIYARRENKLLAKSGLLDIPHSPPPTDRSLAKTGKSVGLSPSKVQAHSPAHVFMPGIRLDARQTPLLDCHLSPEYAMGRGNACKKKTLVNKTVVAQRQQQIEMENKRLRRRLLEQKPYYNTKKWDSEWQQHGHKFHHLRQDGTVGHLLPKPSRSRRPSGIVEKLVGGQNEKPAIKRCPMVPTQAKSKKDLPSIHENSKNRASSRAARLEQHANFTSSLQSANTASGVGSDAISDHEDNAPVVQEGEPYILLEAKTAQGICLQVEEVPIQIYNDPNTPDEYQLGDRGLTVIGAREDGLKDRYSAPLDLLRDAAQDIDDLEIMIKLETIMASPSIGNLPRLSTLLTDDELEKLLVRVLEQTQIQVIDDPPSLSLTSRYMQAKKANNSPNSQTKDRPKSCPATFLAENEQLVLDQENIYSMFEDLLRHCRRRRGIKRNGSYFIVKYALGSASYALEIQVLMVSDMSFLERTHISLDAVALNDLLERIQRGEMACDDFILPHVNALIDTIS